MTGWNAQIKIEAPQPVSGLLLNPPEARPDFVFAHGAGIEMAHPFMAAPAVCCSTAASRLTVSVPLHGEGGQAPGHSGDRQCVKIMACPLTVM
jgi:hypothetical protein